MFHRMVRGALIGQKGKMLMIALTIALGASLATAMLNVMLDVGDKVNQELKAYGANITVVPQGASVLDELYDVDAGDSASAQYIAEDDLGKIKTIFWAFNIVDFSPYLETKAEINDRKEKVQIVGAWFNHHLDLPTGEELDTGATSMKSWWEVDGDWIDEQNGDDVNQAMVGVNVAEKYNIKKGDTITVKKGKEKYDLKVTGTFDAGGDEDDQIFTPLAVAQGLSAHKGQVSKIEVSALTTPDNELAKKAAQNPDALSISEYETWYCTAYVSSICYQIQEVIPDSVASPLRQVADSEGAILDKTQLLMILITALSLLGAAMSISNLVTASVMERSQEIGLLKALGAGDSAVSVLVLTEIMITALIGTAIGYFVGIGFAQIIGKSVFDAAIDIKPLVIPIVILLILVVTLIGSIPAIKTLQRLRPAEVLHGRQ